MKKTPNHIDRIALRNPVSNNADSERVRSNASVQSKKSLTPIDKKDLDAGQDHNASSAVAKPKSSVRTRIATNSNEMLETAFLNSRDTKQRTSTSVSLHVKIHIALLLIGLIGTIGCVWSMLYTSNAKTIANNFGLERVANSLENILTLLAYPVLMFTVILTVYSIQQLYLAHRRASYLDNDTRRKKR